MHSTLCCPIFSYTYVAVRSWLSTDGDELLAVIIGLLNVLSWLFLALFIVTQVRWLTESIFLVYVCHHP